jgi:hypothetical protein
MFLAAHASGSLAGFFWRSGTSVKKSAWKVAPDSVLLVKFCWFAFLRSCFPAFGRPRLPGWRSGLLGSRQKAGKRQLKNAKKAPKTEHKNVGLYAQKTAHSAY